MSVVNTENTPSSAGARKTIDKGFIDKQVDIDNGEKDSLGASLDDDDECFWC